MFEVKSEQELINLLKIIAEEAVESSRKTLNESEDPYVDKLASNIKSDPLLEQEDIDEDEPEEEEEAKEVSDEPPMPAKEKAKNLSIEAEDFGASFDSMVTAINTLRAGRSLKDTQIRDETSKYYDGLSDDERKVLLIFLNSLSQILTGAIEGSEAIDPSDPPMNLKISHDSSESPDQEKRQPQQTRQSQVTQSKVSSTGEDTSPPIRVNESQDTKFLRAKIRKLMNS